jgi:hypothetical protein
MDIDGRWTIKRGRQRAAAGGPQARVAAEIAVPVFGYKNHLGIDRRHGFIPSFTVTDAATHDGGQLGRLLDPDNPASQVWADTAPRSAATTGGRRWEPGESLGGQPRTAGAARAGAPVPGHRAARPADATAHRARQRQPGAHPGRGRARLRRPEVPARLAHPHSHPPPRQNQARPRQPVHRHAPARLIRTAASPRVSSA